MKRKVTKSRTGLFFWIVLFFAIYVLLVTDTPRKLWRAAEDYFFFNYVPEEKLFDYAKKKRFQKVVARDPRASSDVIEYIANTVINTPKADTDDSENNNEKKDILYGIIENPNAGEEVLEDINDNIDVIGDDISCSIRQKLAVRTDLSKTLIKELAKHTDCGCEYMLTLAKKENLEDQDKLNILNQILPDFNSYININKDDEKCIISVLDEYSKIEKTLLSENGKTQKDIYTDFSFLFELYSFYNRKYNENCKTPETEKIANICSQFTKIIADDEILNNTNSEFVKK